MGGLVLSTILLVRLASSEFRFVAFGDWGSDTKMLKATMSAVTELVPERDFMILLGDNAYPAGVSSVNDPHFDIFRNTVASGSTIPHHVILGNHDYMGVPQAEIDFSSVDARWDMPSRYYKRTYSRGGVQLCLLFIDTVNFDQPQVDWIAQQLAADDCNTDRAWTIVSGHYPIWSSGMYADSPELEQKLLPLLRQYKVPMYLCGHEHLHEVFYDGIVTQVVSGASMEARPARQFKAHPEQIWGVSGSTVSGFINVHASTDALDVEIPSSYSLLNFVKFSLSRTGEKASMFGHIGWTFSDSNRDAYIASPTPSGGPTSVPLAGAPGSGSWSGVLGSVPFLIIIMTILAFN